MAKLANAVEATAIRPFQVNIPDAELTELRRRINATKWPDRETVTEGSQGVLDGLDIHFIHVRSRHDDAMPLIVTHGWPGSLIEQLKIIDPLTNPTAHGGSASDAFHVVIPRWPATGFPASPRRRVGTPLAWRGRGWS
jgi:hypothetical protein